MSAPRRFFSGNSLAQAMMAATRHYGLPPEQLAYAIHEKRHGFVRRTRNVVIEVDPAAPRRAAGVEAATTVAEARRAPAPDAPARPQPGRTGQGARPGRRGSSPPEEPRGKGAAGAEKRPARRPHERREIWSEPDEEALLATAEAARAVVALSGLELEVEVRAGEGRVEVELSGAAEAEVRRHGLPLLGQMELLIPRAAHGLSGRMARCRVDCGGLHGAREARLRELARIEVDAVRATGEARLTEPLSPGDRRIIHLELADVPDVETASLGDGLEKRVRISPRLAPT